MKVILLILSVIHVCFVSGAYELDRVDGVDGLIEVVGFDSDGNIFTASGDHFGDQNEEHNLYKLSSNNELLWSVKFPDWVELVYKILITRDNDVYIFLWADLKNYLAIVRSGSQTVEVIEEFQDDLFILDQDDNLLYGRDAGLHILRPKSDTPVLIKNLEDFYVLRTQDVAFDSKGNLYLAVNSKVTYNNSIVLLTREELQKEVPEAKFIEVLDNGGQNIADIISDDEDNVWIFISHQTANEGTIKKLENGMLQTIVKADYPHPDIDGVVAKDRIFVVAADILYPNIPSIYYITLDNEVKIIPELQNLTYQRYFFGDGVADEDGTVYFKTFNEFTPEIGSMFIIKAGNDEVIPVRMDDDRDIIDVIDMDFNGDVWLKTSTEYMYFIKKGEVVANRIKHFNGICDSVHSNLVTKNVYVACNYGLYVAVPEE